VESDIQGKDAPATPPSTPSPLEQLRGYTGSVIAERYELVRLLGQGSMACVYLANDARLGQCAVKLTLPTVDPKGTSLARFRREHDLASVLKHPNICRAFDIGEIEGGVWYIAIEYVDGKSLYQCLEDGGRKGLPLDDVLSFGYQLFSGLEAAHAREVAHRDVKPPNLCVLKSSAPNLRKFGRRASAA